MEFLFDDWRLIDPNEQRNVAVSAVSSPVRNPIRTFAHRRALLRGGAPTACSGPSHLDRAIDAADEAANTAAPGLLNVFDPKRKP